MEEQIIRKPLSTLGYNFISNDHIPEGMDEYYLRNQQLGNIEKYRTLSQTEVTILQKNGNTSDDWNKVLVADPIDIHLIRCCKFYGLVRIGNLEASCLTYSDIVQPVGLYDSTIISCDFGDNVSIHHVHYMSHYIVGDEIILTDIKEMITTSHSKFGNGILKSEESENIRIWLELCNENGGRKVLPFDGMLSGDAWLWSRFRNDKLWQNRLLEMTESLYDKRRGYYGRIGNYTVIKHATIIKDVLIGENAYIKGASKIKNVTIHSGKEGHTQIGEGCEIVNGIIGFGCRLFYGVKAVRFVLGNHSQLKYGARLINSFLGSNSTISCCEVLNALIFPAHEQHHNNSFLCAAVVMGQSNIPAGATLGSNHNSRSADGEFIAGRGFWPALCSNIKHNSKFATFTMLGRGNYPYELNIPIPFSLVSCNEEKQQLEIMVGYWFLYDLYALERNASKYMSRDKRIERVQNLEYDYLAPDSINEMLHALSIIESAVEENVSIGKLDILQKLSGRQILQTYPDLVKKMTITISGVEHSYRNVVLTKVVDGWNRFRTMLKYYSLKQLWQYIENNSFDELLQASYPDTVSVWSNIGGQLIPEKDIVRLKESICNGEINSWDEVHQFYLHIGSQYSLQKTQHAFIILKSFFDIDVQQLDKSKLKNILSEFIDIENEILSNIIISRKKDYTSPFRTMMYDSAEEMDAVIGSFDENEFILGRKKEAELLISKIQNFLSK